MELHQKVDKYLWEKSDKLQDRFNKFNQKGEELSKQTDSLKQLQGIAYDVIPAVFCLALNIVIFGGLFLFLRQFVGVKL